MTARHRVTALGLLAALLPAGVAASAAAAPPPAQPLVQAQAQALATAPAAVASGSETRAVSPQEALAAAGLAGATVTVAPGLSLRQAVGLAPAVSTAAVTACSANAAWHEWGTWPYQQRITDTTYWCAVYGSHITYRSSSVAGSGTLCGTSWTTSQLVSGGIGYSWFVMRSSAGFACPTVVPWITLHPSHYLDVSRNAWGSTAEVGSS
jgi:hypothetical protein